jgi:uncharacterized membrane protein required for colicin V production
MSNLATLRSLGGSFGFLWIQAPEAGAGGLRWIDLLGLAVLTLFLALGAMRGLWWQLVRLLGIVASVSVARALAPRLSPQLASLMPGLSPLLANGLAWLAILIACMLVVALIGRLGHATLEAVHLGKFDRIGGALAGLASGVLVHAVVLLCLCQVATSAWTVATVRGTRSQDLLDVVADHFPMLLDARAAESVRQIHEPAQAKH